MKPTERFSGLADLYAASRPSYPKEAIDFILTSCNLSPSSLIVDVGCGTGISTRLFAERAVRLIGIEPNADMRRQAEALANEVGTRPEYRDGTAESTGIVDDSVDAVLSAQAFHWFNPDAALAEFYRILKPHGFVVLMWNERNESDNFTRGYGDLFRLLPETASIEMKRGSAGIPLLECKLFKQASQTIFDNDQTMNLDQLIGRAFSASYAPRDGTAADALRDGLIDLFKSFESDGLVTLHYTTSVFLGQK
ncbi:MAG: class I SAM-dependent methyltransferase [Candidatus Obscuribacterales bacterium]|nr:class I SAM-dependent methyltransferase [Candidatus Obscuribacterales bacterium]